MYKVLKVGDGWLVFYIEEGKPPRPADGRVKPYAQKTHAYRRARKLNKDLQEIDAMIAKNGAIIL